MRDRAAAGLIAGAASGAPSTVWALLRGEDPLAATRAAGAILLPDGEGTPLLAAAGVVHAAVSLAWAAVFPRRAGVFGGAVFGLAIAALDLGVLARRFPRIRALPLGPQLADHMVYGAVVGLALRPGRAGGRGRR